MGRKTSVYLSDELSERMKASGRKHADILTAGLDSIEKPASAEPPVTATEVREIIGAEAGALGDTMRRAVREELERVAGQSHA